ncbi:MAG TPA: hypothetical protein VLH81_11135 [Desulfobacterales bacterium]|nr:hypothetical protein [Desulfobacterales bacterium]
MATEPFPRTTVGGVSLSRMLIGTNWMLGWSHTSSAADALIHRTARNAAAIADIVATFLERGVDAVMSLFPGNDALIDGVKLAEDRVGRKVVRIDTPIIDVADTPEARRSAEAMFDQSRALGATFCMPHHTSVEQLVDKGRQRIHRLPDYLAMIRDRGMIPGLSAHMPEVIVYADANGYDVETYIQIYNCAGFLMQVEVEYIHRVIWNAKKPVMSIKPMAAGRVSPFVGLSFSWATLRPCDMVTVGCLTPEEAAEDVEISLAALERRRPDLEGRSSPKKTEIMK